MKSLSSRSGKASELTRMKLSSIGSKTLKPFREAAMRRLFGEIASPVMKFCDKEPGSEASYA